ncbi:MAG TPA: hypothetical protein VFA03_05720 [Acetobacteraceae bacterium]|nr:hypothetical protein [Acetobacteraceae bacterium]
MATWDDSIAAGEAALGNLYRLQTAAMKAGNLAAQKALGNAISDLTYKLTQLQSLAIADDDTQIAALNAQLDRVTTAGQAALHDLTQLAQVLNDIAAAAKLLDTVIGTASKL